jgi:hypothetical protein
VKFTNEDIESIAGILEAKKDSIGQETVLYIGSGRSAPPVVLTLTNLAGDHDLVSAQTVHGYFELHNIGRFVPVEPGEVIFVSEEENRISGLVVGKEGTCSLFANVDRAALSADFTTLEPALLLAAMQLGLAENIAT